MKNLISFKEFSKQLLESGDIDPDYHFMREFALKNKMKKHELLQWICYKVVIYRSVSELEVFYGVKGLSDKNLKFGNERNKARNKAEQYYLNIIRFFQHYPITTKSDIFNNVTKVSGFGPWARWKLVDLLSCVYGYHLSLEHVDFRKAYEFPLKGLLMVNSMEEDITLLSSDKVYNFCMARAWAMMPKVKSTPHNNNEGVRINELETLLCKYHSYIHGHYYPGKDLEHLRKDIKNSNLKQLKKFKWSL